MFSQDDLEVPLVSGGYSRCLFLDARGDWGSA